MSSYCVVMLCVVVVVGRSWVGCGVVVEGLWSDCGWLSRVGVWLV